MRERMLILVLLILLLLLLLLLLLVAEHAGVGRQPELRSLWTMRGRCVCGGGETVHQAEPPPARL